MAKTFKIGIRYLFPKLFTHTDIVRGLCKSARTISVLPFKPFAYRLHYFFVGIENNFHFIHQKNVFSIGIILQQKKI